MLSVFNIQRFSIHDGEGIRTLIFFKGCPLRCAWCNNPEGIDPMPAIMFDERLCQQFNDCIEASDGIITTENGRLVIRRNLVSDASFLRNICPSKALTVVGELISAGEIIDEVKKDIPFYMSSNGGVTLSGGEPFSQGKDLMELLTGLRSLNINVSVETSLHLPWEVILPYVELIDVFLADLKHTDKEKFREYTSGDLSLVIDNFKKLDSTGKCFVVRVPVIPGFNFSIPELHSIIDFASDLKNIAEIHFIPYHSLAREKYLMAGKDYIFGNQRNIEKQELTPFVEYANGKGLIAKIMN
jgi:pyruvate formate lyase activating enzyme